MKTAQEAIDQAAADLSRALVGPQDELLEESIAEWMQSRLEHEGYYVKHCRASRVADGFNVEVAAMPINAIELKVTVRA
jgi:hypothetical protein